MSSPEGNRFHYGAVDLFQPGVYRKLSQAPERRIYVHHLTTPAPIHRITHGSLRMVAENPSSLIEAW